jgi:large subunit ribosomal protein L18
MSNMTPQQKRATLKRKIRSTISGTATRPRLAVFRSNRFIYAQLIDDAAGRTIAAATDRGGKDDATKMNGAIAAGTEIAKQAAAKGVTTAVFDRGGFRYAGRIKALADAARAGGLQF